LRANQTLGKHPVRQQRQPAGRMMTSKQATSGRNRLRRLAFGLGAAVAVCATGAGLGTAMAQGMFNWPWDQPQERKPAQQPAPAWQPPPEPAARPAAPLAGGRRPAICLQLEQRLVQEGQAGNQSRDLIPMVESQLRQVDQQYRQSSSQLERSDCYDYFLFSKTLRSTRKCVDLAREVDRLKRQRSDLETQRGQLIASSGRSYQDEIVRELARNNCGSTYSQQAARSNNSNPFSSIWQEDSGGTGGGLGGSFSSLPYATYRTMCVRLCDGYYFPVSFSTLPNHFERDAETCQSKCAAPTELFYYQNPGSSVEQMVGAQSNTPYTSMKTAFRYRKEYVQGCSCKQEEFNAGNPAAGGVQQGALPGGNPGTITGALPGTAPTQDAGAAASGWSSETMTVP
jgi:hypothetical protein